jgi:hypothetical protein
MGGLKHQISEMVWRRDCILRMALVEGPQTIRQCMYRIDYSGSNTPGKLQCYKLPRVRRGRITSIRNCGSIIERHPHIDNALPFTVLARLP